MAQVGDKNIRWKLGSPTYAASDDKIRVFISGTAPRINPNEERRYVADFENWKKANGVWITKDDREVPFTVTEGILKKDDDYRTWVLVPFTEDGKNGINLVPNFKPSETQDDLFNGNFARVVDCLVLRKDMKKLMDYLNSNEKFDRTSAASTIGNKWGIVSGHLARIYNYGFISELLETRRYGIDSKEVLSMKGEKCRELGSGNHRVYEKSCSWSTLWAEWENFLDSGESSRTI